MKHMLRPVVTVYKKVVSQQRLASLFLPRHQRSMTNRTCKFREGAGEWGHMTTVQSLSHAGGMFRAKSSAMQRSYRILVGCCTFAVFLTPRCAHVDV